jgi:hypothetical protein
VFLSGGIRADHSKPYSKRGALLYCVGLSVCAFSWQNLRESRVRIFVLAIIEWTIARKQLAVADWALFDIASGNVKLALDNPAIMAGD